VRFVAHDDLGQRTQAPDRLGIDFDGPQRRCELPRGGHRETPHRDTMRGPEQDDAADDVASRREERVGVCGDGT
jgi:hypothetical protein